MIIRPFRKGDDVEEYLASLTSELAANGVLARILTADALLTTATSVAPRLTTTERDALTTKTAGMIIYNTTTGAFNVYTTAWKVVTVT